MPEGTFVSLSAGAGHTCALDADGSISCWGESGGGSYDADDDELTYSWVITSGSTYGSIDDDTSATPVVTITGATTSYGETVETEVEVELTVTDCMGATSSDTVRLSLACTGS